MVDPAAYDSVRPRYPRTLLDLCADVLGITSSTRLLEVGAGTGIATREFLEWGCEIDALEPDARFAHYLGAHIPSSRLSIHTCDLADWCTATPAHHAIAASSWHWIEKERSCAALENAVLPGGLLAVLEYHHCAGGDMEAFTKIHDMDPQHRSPRIRSAADVEGTIRAQWMPHSPVLPPTTVEVAIPYTAASYLALIRTYPDILGLSPPEYEQVCSAASTIIDALPDRTIIKNYLFSLTIIRITSTGSRQ